MCTAQDSHLTCLFLSSVIRWIWIFFLPMVPWDSGNGRPRQSRRERPLGGCDLRPLTLAQIAPDTVMHATEGTLTHTNTHTRTHSNVGFGGVDDAQFIVCSVGTKVANCPPPPPTVAVVRQTSLSSYGRETQTQGDRDREVRQHFSSP